MPLANIFLTFILLSALDITGSSLLDLFTSKVKLWKRYIDDCTGVFKGHIDDFKQFFVLLQNAFRKFGLEITCETDSYVYKDNNFVEKDNQVITFLDVELYKDNGCLSSREHRKETSACSYLLSTSAHPKHTFAGIVKSQLLRLRRICSNDLDYLDAVKELKVRCLNSGYNHAMVDRILALAPSLERNLEYTSSNIRENVSNKHLNVRLVILSGTLYEHDFIKFSRRMNSLFQDSGLQIDIVSSTSLSLSRLLFNNHQKQLPPHCTDSKCQVCKYGTLNVSGMIKSNATGHSYVIDNTLNCTDGGIYVVTGACHSQYTGKTIDFCKRFKEHLSTSKSSTVYQHKTKCAKCYIPQDFGVTYVENTHCRGKYSLSEREHLWNHRIKGSMNVQKTLSAN